MNKKRMELINEFQDQHLKGILEEIIVKDLKRKNGDGSTVTITGTGTIIGIAYRSAKWLGDKWKPRHDIRYEVDFGSKGVWYVLHGEEGIVK